MHRPALAWKAGLQALPVTLSRHLVLFHTQCSTLSEIILLLAYLPEQVISCLSAAIEIVFPWVRLFCLLLSASYPETGWHVTGPPFLLVC